MLQVNDLTVRFGDVTAVDQLDVVVETGEVVSVLGPSGCGKTTLLRLIAGQRSGVVAPDNLPYIREHVGLRWQTGNRGPRHYGGLRATIMP